MFSAALLMLYVIFSTPIARPMLASWLVTFTIVFFLPLSLEKRKLNPPDSYPMISADGHSRNR